MPLGGVLRKPRNSVSMAALNVSQVIFGHILDIVFSLKQLVYGLKLEDISMNLFAVIGSLPGSPKISCYPQPQQDKRTH